MILEANRFPDGTRNDLPDFDQGATNRSVAVANAAGARGSLLSSHVLMGAATLVSRLMIVALLPDAGTQGSGHRVGGESRIAVRAELAKVGSAHVKRQGALPALHTRAASVDLSMPWRCCRGTGVTASGPSGWACRALKF
jgi:hypothetical protein